MKYFKFNPSILRGIITNFLLIFCMVSFQQVYIFIFNKNIGITAGIILTLIILIITVLHTVYEYDSNPKMSGD